VEVGRADGGGRIGTRGSIRQRWARPHGRPFHGGGAMPERRQGKGERKVEERDDVAA
jgi:hypothetical protein